MANLLQKLIFRSGISFYHCWCWHCKSYVSAYIIWWVFGPHAGDIWTKSCGPNHTNFCAFYKKMVNSFDKVLTPRRKTFLWLKQLFDAKILIQILSSFSVWHVLPGKGCTKHGRPDQSQRKLTVALMDKMSVYFRQVLSCFAKKVHTEAEWCLPSKSLGSIWRKRHKWLSCFEKFEDGSYHTLVDHVKIAFWLTLIKIIFISYMLLGLISSLLVFSYNLW